MGDTQEVGSFFQLSTVRRHGSHVQSLPHHVHDKFRGWVVRAPAPQPMVITTVRLCEEGYQELSLPLPRVTNMSALKSAMADSGAQKTVAGMNLAHALGITRRKLIPLATKLKAAGSNALGMLGGLLISITVQDEDGNNRQTRQLCYVSEMIYTMFLSEQRTFPVSPTPQPMVG